MTSVIALSTGSTCRGLSENSAKAMRNRLIQMVLLYLHLFRSKMILRAGQTFLL